MELLKECRKCKKKYNINNFHVNKKAKDGLQTICVSCAREYYLNRKPKGININTRIKKIDSYEKVKNRILDKYGHMGLECDEVVKVYDKTIARLKAIIASKEAMYKEYKYSYKEWEKKTKSCKKIKIKELTIKQKDIIKRKIDGESLESIGMDYGISKERVRQIVSKALLWDLYHKTSGEN
jgi:DNA-directed RNA polymerase sigma subunit (sigma70/sigma32)